MLTPARLLDRYGSACTVNETFTLRNKATGQVTTTTTMHEGTAYRQKASEDVMGLNPNVSAMLIVSLTDGYEVGVKDTITHEGKTEKVLGVHTVRLPSGIVYQTVGV